MQYFLIIFVNAIFVSIVCAICLWRWFKSIIAWSNLWLWWLLFSACSYNFIMFIILLMNVLLWVSEFFGYDVRFVDVVKFDYRNFWFLWIRFYFMCNILYSSMFFMCTSIMLIISVFCFVFNSVWSWQMLLLLGFD